MNNSMRRLLLVSGLLALALSLGCATKIKASVKNNPPPTEAFSAYGRIDIKPVVFASNYSGNGAGLAKIQANLTKDLTTSMDAWNQRSANGRTLVIEPIVEEMQFQHGAKRVFLGPLAGSSGVLLRLNIRDLNGTVVATPEFYQRADAWAAGFLLGVHDNLMLTRVSNLASNYIIGNFSNAAGGPSGADDKAIYLK